MKNCKVRLEDRAYKKNWEKEGDYGLVAIGDRTGGATGGPNIEVDFGALTEQDMAFLLATILKVAHNGTPKAVQYALVLFSQAVRGERPVNERMEVDRGLTINKSKAGGTDKGSSSKN